MRLFRSRSSARSAKPFRPAELYLAAGADEARLLGHAYVGTEHVLLALTRDPESNVSRLLRRFNVTHAAIEASPCLIGMLGSRIDTEALAALRIDFESVRQRLEETFGPGALQSASAGFLCVAPRLKIALARAIDYAGERPLRDEHVLLGMLSVRDSLAAQILFRLGVSRQVAESIVRNGNLTDF